MKEIIWHPAARATIRNFPEEVKGELGYRLFQLQKGVSLGQPFSKPVKAVGAGVSELRVKDKTGIYRAFYLVKSEEGVCVFHAFKKKTQKTPSSEINKARKRLRELIDNG